MFFEKIYIDIGNYNFFVNRFRQTRSIAIKYKIKKNVRKLFLL